MENIKSKIIPDEMKENIDIILEQQLFNANRYYAESNFQISDLMAKELSRDPQTFLKKLKERWNWHNSFYELLLEPAMPDIIKFNHLELSSKEVEDLISIYNTCCIVDETTLVMSGSIKKYLDINCYKTSFIDENLSKEESSFMLVTPPIETFFAQYQMDHLFYIYLIKTNISEANKYRKILLEKYHAGDLKIFYSRFRKYKYFLNKSITEKEILKEIKDYKISDEYKIKHFYFTLEHPERKAIRDIIIFDNLDEKLIACNLIGISGFLLRKKILEYLNDSNILPNKGYIYEFSNSVIITSLEKLKSEREKVMNKNINIYKQRQENTCAIACMMMVMEYFDKMSKANWFDEKRYYRLYGSKYMDGTPFSALAYHFSKSGLNTTIFHSESEMFTNSKETIDKNNFKLLMKEYNEMLQYAKKHDTKVQNGIDINSELLKVELDKGNLIVLAGEVYGVYHAIILSGYDNVDFIVCDPLFNSTQRKSASEIEKFMNTNIGKWFISVNNKTRKKDILLNSLEKFEEEANSFNKSNNNKEKIYEKK